MRPINNHPHPSNRMPGPGLENQAQSWLQQHGELINNLILSCIAGLARWCLKPDIDFKRGALRFFGGVMLALTAGMVIRNNEWLHQPAMNNFIVAFCAIAGDRIVKLLLNNVPAVFRWLLMQAGSWAGKQKTEPDNDVPPET